MISAIVPFVLSLVTGAAPKPAPAVTAPEPAIRITLNHRTYDRGDRARVNVRVRDDGYVVVMHTDASGHVRVLFPVDPGDDNFLKGGQEYEIRGRGDREAFQVTRSGTGTVYAAVSQDPFHFDSFVRNDHWDYGVIDDSALVDDPETGMTNLVEQMANGVHFDYDVTTYTMESTYASSPQAYIPPVSYSCWYNTWDPWCDGYYPGPSYFGVGIGFGFGNFYGNPYGYGYPYGYGFGFPRFPIVIVDRGHHHRGYGATGYGYTVGRGWSYNHRPIVLGPGGGHIGGGFGFGTGTSIGYKNRGAFVGSRGGISPLYGVSRFNTQPQHNSFGGVRGPSRRDDSPNRGRRGAPGVINAPPAGRQPARGAHGDNGPTRRPSDEGGMRPATRGNEGRRGGSQRSPESRMDGQSAPTRVEPRVDSRPIRIEPRGGSQPERVQPRTNGDARPTRVEPREQPRMNDNARPTRVEPREQPRSEPRAQPRAEPRSEPRSEPRAQPRSEPRSSGSSHPSSRGGGGGGGGGRRSGGGGGHRP